jgi:copper(I)-binding protein
VADALAKGRIVRVLQSCEVAPLPVHRVHSGQGRLRMKLRARLDLDFDAPAPAGALRCAASENAAALGGSKGRAVAAQGSVVNPSSAVASLGDMRHSISRRQLLNGGLAFSISLLAPQARACEFFSSNLRIFHPWTRATEEGAEFAVVCMKFDEVLQDERLIGVETPIASGAEMGGPGASPTIDFVIRAGHESVLSETGTHIRLTGLKHAVEVARAYPLKLVFERGGEISALLNVDYTSFRFK